MKRIVVTGGSGKAGRAVVADLLTHGYDVLNADLVPPAERTSRFIRADLTDLGQTYEVLRGADGVVHLAAIPAPGLQPDEITFRVNTLSTYNVFSAAVALGIGRVVWASSETTLGLPFEHVHPAYAPIDEEHPLFPETSYALSKVVGETMAEQFARWTRQQVRNDIGGAAFVGLRISNIMEAHDYARFPSFWADATLRKWNLWGYVDARDVAQACRLGLTAQVMGAGSFIIAAADTCMNRPSRDLLAEVFPGVPLSGDIGEYETLLCIDKARAALGYAPEHSWRSYIA